MTARCIQPGSMKPMLFAGKPHMSLALYVYCRARGGRQITLQGLLQPYHALTARAQRAALDASWARLGGRTVDEATVYFLLLRLDSRHTTC
jgi:hypothetical protein